MDHPHNAAVIVLDLQSKGQWFVSSLGSYVIFVSSIFASSGNAYSYLQKQTRLRQAVVLRSIDNWLLLNNWHGCLVSSIVGALAFHCSVLGLIPSLGAMDGNGHQVFPKLFPVL